LLADNYKLPAQQQAVTLAASLLHTFASPGKTFDKGITAFHVIANPLLSFYSNLTQILTTENNETNHEIFRLDNFDFNSMQQL